MYLCPIGFLCYNVFMGITIKCYICKEELSEPGALYFSSPETKTKWDRDPEIMNVSKYHFCAYCGEEVEDFINNARIL